MDKVTQLENWRESDIFNAEERVALEYAEAITHSDKQVTDEMVQNLRNYFNEDGIVELTGLIAFQNLASKFNNALDVEPQGFCKIHNADKQTDKLA